MKSDEFILWGREALDQEAKALSDTALKISETFQLAAETIIASQGKVVVTGLGKSGHVARKVAATLASTGTSAFFLHPSEALHGDFGMLQRSDCLLAIAYGGETNEVLEVCRFARRVGIPVVAITGKPESTLGRLAHFVLDGSVSREADPLNLAPTCSSTVAMALGDALAVSLMRAKGFTPQDFASLHPGGSLGRRLSLVKDHMHSGDKLPTVEATADFHTVLEAVTFHNFGITAVLGDRGSLVGAISDGDLRRALLRLDAAALSCRARDLMSAKPKTIVDSALALDALALMNSGTRPFTSLFVTSAANPDRAIGLVRLHDLLAAKIL